MFHANLMRRKTVWGLFFFVSLEISPFWYTRGWHQRFEVEKEMRKKVTTTTQFCRNEPNAPFYGFSSANNVCHKLWFEYNDIFRLLSRARAHKIKVDDFKNLAEEVEREMNFDRLREGETMLIFEPPTFALCLRRGGISQPKCKTSKKPLKITTTWSCKPQNTVVWLPHTQLY